MKSFLFVCSLWIIVQGIHAQGFLYDFEVDNQAWEALENATQLIPGEIWDDPELEIPIGFPFSYFGESYDSLFQIDLGSGFVFERFHLDGPEDVSIPLLFPYVSDIVDRGESQGVSQSPISYLVEGDAGSRIFKLEYLNAGFFEDFSGEDFINFQLWLYEATGVIEVRFGPRQITNFNEVHLDWGGPSVFLIEGYVIFQGGTSGNIANWASITGSSSNPTMSVISDVDPEVLNPSQIAVMSEDPVDGAVYRFSPVITSTRDYLGQRALNLFPTVASESITVEIPEAGELYIVALDGSVVSSNPIGKGTRNVDVSVLTPGQYFVYHVAGNQRTVARFVKP